MKCVRGVSAPTHRSSSRRSSSDSSACTALKMPPMVSIAFARLRPRSFDSPGSYSTPSTTAPTTCKTSGQAIRKRVVRLPGPSP